MLDAMLCNAVGEQVWGGCGMNLDGVAGDNARVSRRAGAGCFSLMPRRFSAKEKGQN
jgi:hypothetical protein